MNVHTIIRRQGRKTNLFMVMARRTFDIPAIMRTRGRPHTFVRMCSLFRENVTWPAVQIFRRSLGQNSAIQITCRCSEQYNAPASLCSLKTYPDINRFLPISRTFIQGLSMASTIRSYSLHKLRYSVFSMPLVRQERLLICFWYKTTVFFDR